MTEIIFMCLDSSTRYSRNIETIRTVSLPGIVFVGPEHKNQEIDISPDFRPVGIRFLVQKTDIPGG
jgi:hypothetical protein